MAFVLLVNPKHELSDVCSAGSRSTALSWKQLVELVLHPISLGLPMASGQLMKALTGNWQLATGNWKLATGNWKATDPGTGPSDAVPGP